MVKPQVVIVPKTGKQGPAGDAGILHHAELDDTDTDGHPASIIETDTTNFDNNLSVADDTTQKALETLDDLVISGGTDDITNDSTVAGATASDALETNAAALTAHEAETETHGTTGDIVGEENVQTLTNKTLDDYTNHIHADAIHFRVKATEDILKGQPVTVTGWNVGEEAYEVELADQAVNVANGLASTDMATGVFGFMEQTGTLTDIDTSTWSEGSILYLDGTGTLTDVEPTTGFAQPIAYVVRSHAVNGALQVNADYPKQDAEDVRIDDTNDYYSSTNVEGVLDEIGETRAINGFDKLDPNSEPDLTFVDGTRTFSTVVKGGESSYHFWSDSKKIVHTTTHSVVVPDVTGTYYIIFDNDGILVAVHLSSLVPENFYENAIVGIVYWNATAGISYVGKECHGKLMDARTHHYNHSTLGARFESGMNIDGLTDGGDTYTQTTSGYFWDEDIRHTVAAQSTSPFIYRLGADGEWNTTTPDNQVSYNDGGTSDVWNEWTGTTWQLTEGLALSDYWIIFYMVTPDIGGYPVKKVIGQNAYANRTQARNAIATELFALETEGLPSEEFIFLYATIVKRTGVIEDDGEGGTYYDLRTTKGGGAGSSGLSSLAGDVATDVTNFDNNLSSADTNVQLALDTIDEFDVGNALKIQGVEVDATGITNTQYLAYNSSTTKYEPASPGTPSAHANTHEDGGADEIDATGLVVGTGVVVGTTEVQTLENKTLDTPVIQLWSGWQPHTGTMPAFVSTTNGIDSLTLTDADDFLFTSAKVEITSAAGTHMYYLLFADATGFELVGETSPSGTITEMRYSYADAPFGFKKGEDWYKAKMALGANQIVATSTETLMELDTDEYDTNNNTNLTSFYWEAPITAKFELAINAGASFSTTTSGLYAKLKTGSITVLFGSGAGSTTISTGETTIDVIRGQQYQLFAFHTAGSDVSFSSHTGIPYNRNFMTIQFTGI